MTEASNSDWVRIKAIAAEAIALAPEARALFIARASGGDSSVQDEVHGLVQAHDRAGRFLEAPALVVTGAAQLVVERVEPPAGAPSLPDRFGAYRVLRELGRGGMGVVYLGDRDDDRFEKHVAIKVVSGDIVQPAILRRFEDERRILASLDHPNIARLLDAGTTEGGSPYVVMEHVAGEAIDAYCSTRSLGVHGRLTLFLQVCSAVQYSHQHLIVHRDIKAGNILVTPDGVPKLLDFGIAKLLDPGGADTSRTRTAFRLLTPESASPEQVRGEPVTVSTDVYSLGVLLYRLLTGKSPYRASLTTDAEIVRAVCEEEPLRPSAVGHRKELRGDLDLITLKALRKDPARRYASVEQLAQDVERHLHRKPVLAAPDAWTYRARKFLARHWVGVGATAAVAVALVAGGTATWWQAKRAERRFNDVRKLARTFMFDVHDAIAKLPGSTAARKLLVAEALAYLDSLAREAGGDASLQRELATGYEKMGDVLGWPNTPNLGDVPGALKAYAKAQVARERVLARDPGNAEVLRDLSRTAQRMSRAWHFAGNAGNGAEEARKATVIEERLAASDHGAAQTLRLARSYANHGFLLYMSGRTVDSIQRQREAIAILERLNAASPTDTEVKGRLAVSFGYLAAVLRLGKPVAGVVPDLKAALQAQRKEVALEESLATAAGATPDTGLQRQIWVGINNLGEILETQGDLNGARDQYRQALARIEQLAIADPANLQARKDLAYSWLSLGRIQMEAGATNEAVGFFNRAETLLEPAVAADPTNFNTEEILANTMDGLARAHAALGADPAHSRDTRLRHWREAKTRFQRVEAIWKRHRASGVVAPNWERLEGMPLQIARCDAALGIGR